MTLRVGHAFRDPPDDGCREWFRRRIAAAARAPDRGRIRQDSWHIYGIAQILNLYLDVLVAFCHVAACHEHRCAIMGQLGIAGSLSRSCRVQGLAVCGSFGPLADWSGTFCLHSLSVCCRLRATTKKVRAVFVYSCIAARRQFGLSGRTLSLKFPRRRLRLPSRLFVMTELGSVSGTAEPVSLRDSAVELCRRSSLKDERIIGQLSPAHGVAVACGSRRGDFALSRVVQ